MVGRDMNVKDKAKEDREKMANKNGFKEFLAINCK
jgi:hypothetical protein